MAKQRIVTLLTDFGLADPYVAQMKAVILSIAPGATIVDVSHDVSPGDILAGAFVLRQTLPYFPQGTVHCVVVDPTVGTGRRIMAARFAGQNVVFPDNGVIGLVERDCPLEQIVVVRNRQYFLAAANRVSSLLGDLPAHDTSATFHGRDIIAPVAAHLLAGLAMDRLGPAPDKFKLLEVPQPQQAPDGSVIGEVIYVDNFGNLISNISAETIGRAGDNLDEVEVLCAGKNVGALKRAYAFARTGEPMALMNSMLLVEVAVNGGRACDVLRAGVGAEIRLERPQADPGRTR